MRRYLGVIAIDPKNFQIGVVVIEAENQKEAEVKLNDYIDHVVKATKAYPKFWQIHCIEDIETI